MKKLNKYILIGITSLILICPFLIPITKAQEWTYDGVDTTNIPDFSVYPSEMYVFNVSGAGTPPGFSIIVEIVHGNITDYTGSGNGTCVWGNTWLWNRTSGEKTLMIVDSLFAYWNDTLEYTSQNLPYLIPVENNGLVSLSILNKFSEFSFFTSLNFEHKQAYPNIYSIGFWNTSNNAILTINYTDDGILSQWESYLIPILPNITLDSQPAQLSPVFSFSTDDDILTINSTDFKIATTITDTDNNNDGVTDSDYLYRILNGSMWTDWAAPTGLLDWDLGSVPAGNYTITMEVKNMYGVTQEEITIEYIPPAVITNGDGDDPGFVSGYPIFLISMVAILGIIVIIYRYRKKMKF